MGGKILLAVLLRPKLIQSHLNTWIPSKDTGRSTRDKHPLKSKYKQGFPRE